MNTKDLSPVHCRSRDPRCVNVDHDTPLLLPPNLRDWVPRNPLAHCILDAVQTVEPVFGIIKSVMGFRRFLLRGLTKVRLEWTLVSTAYNLKRLHRMATAVG